MCLVSVNPNTFVNSENIICYKVLKEDMTSPYRDYKYSEITVAEGEPYVIPFQNLYIVETGFLHSYKNIESAKVLVHETLRKSHFKCKIFKCEIPAGTPYYVGLRDDLCSTQLKILEEYHD